MVTEHSNDALDCVKLSLGVALCLHVCDAFLVDSDIMKSLLWWAVTRNSAFAYSLSKAVELSLSISVSASAVQQMKLFRSIGSRMYIRHIDDRKPVC